MFTSNRPKSGIDRGRLLMKVLFQAGFLLVLMALFLFLSAWRLDWLMGWVMLALFVIGNYGTLIVLILVNPDLAKERVEVPGEPYKWDQLLTNISNLLLFFGMLPLAGFDHRLGWSQPFPVWVRGLGLILFILAGSLISWAMLTNRFFTSAIRIQAERGHAVISSGPYRWVRHPGYVGMILQFVMAPLALGSWWAVIPGVLSGVCYVVRTALEDQTLQKELAGYAGYAKKVRYRLLPGVW